MRAWFRGRRRPRRTIVTVILTAVVAVTGVVDGIVPATAATVGSAGGRGLVTVCVDGVTGAVQLSTADAACPSRSVPLTWNVPGIPGPREGDPRPGGYEGSGLVLACTDVSSGVVRIVTDNSKVAPEAFVDACTPRETPRSWRIVGPQGPSVSDPRDDRRFPQAQALACPLADGTLRIVEWDTTPDRSVDCGKANEIRWYLNGPPGPVGPKAAKTTTTSTTSPTTTTANPRVADPVRIPVPRLPTTTAEPVDVTIPVGIPTTAPVTTKAPDTGQPSSRPVPSSVPDTTTTQGTQPSSRPVPPNPYDADGPLVPDGVIPRVCFVGAIGQRAVAGRFGYEWLPEPPSATSGAAGATTTTMQLNAGALRSLLGDASAGGAIRGTGAPVTTTATTGTTAPPTTAALTVGAAGSGVTRAVVPAGRNNRTVDDLQASGQAPFFLFLRDGRASYSADFPLIERSYEWQIGRPSGRLAVSLARNTIVSAQNTCPRDGFDALVRAERGLLAPTALVQTQSSAGGASGAPALGGIAPLTGPTTSNEPLRRGQAATMAVIGRNVGTTARSGTVLVVGQLPEGTTALQVGSVIAPPPQVGLSAATQRVLGSLGSFVDPTVVQLANQADAQLGMQAFWRCAVDGQAFSCLGTIPASSPVAPGAELPPVYAQFTVSPSSPALFDADVAFAVSSPTFDSAAALAQGPSNLGRGVAGLPGYGRTSFDVTGWVADAGEDQTVDARIVKPDGIEVAGKVILDGVGTTASGRPQTFRWRQVAGPLTSWSPEIITDAGAAVGKQVVVVAPDVRTLTNVVYELTVDDGVEIHRDMVRITFRPLNHAPRIVSFTPGLTDAAIAPAAGTSVPLTVVVEDPETDDVVSVSWRAVGPNGPITGAVVADAASDRRATLTWPAAMTEVGIEVTATDQGGLATVKTFSLGTAAPPLRVEISPLKADYVSEYQVLSLLATANRPLATYRWRVKSGPAVLFLPAPSCAGPVKEACDFIIIKPGQTAAAGDVIVMEVTATEGASTVTAEVSVPFSPIPPPRIEDSSWIDDPALTPTATRRTDLVEIETVEGRKPYRYSFVQRMGPPATIGAVVPGPAPRPAPAVVTPPTGGSSSGGSSSGGSSSGGSSSGGATGNRSQGGTETTVARGSGSGGAQGGTETTVARGSGSQGGTETTVARGSGSQGGTETTVRPATPSPARLQFPRLTSAPNASTSELADLNAKLDAMRGKTPAEIAAVINTACTAAETTARSATPPTFVPNPPPDRIGVPRAPRSHDRGFDVDGREQERYVGPALRALQANTACRLDYERAARLLDAQTPSPELVDATPSLLDSGLSGRMENEVLKPLRDRINDKSSVKTCGLYIAYVTLSLGFERQLQLLGASDSGPSDIASMLSNDSFSTCLREEKELCVQGTGDPQYLMTLPLAVARQRELLGVPSDGSVLVSPEWTEAKKAYNDCRAARGLAPNPYTSSTPLPAGSMEAYCRSEARLQTDGINNAAAGRPSAAPTSGGRATRPRPSKGFDADLDAAERDLIGDNRALLIQELNCRLAPTREQQLRDPDDKSGDSEADRAVTEMTALFDQKVNVPLKRAAESSCAASLLLAGFRSAQTPGSPTTPSLAGVNVRRCLDEEFELCRDGSDPVFLARAALRVEKYERKAAETSGSSATTGLTPMGTYGFTRYHECRRRRSLPFLDPLAAIAADTPAATSTGNPPAAPSMAMPEGVLRAGPVPLQTNSASGSATSTGASSTSPLATLTTATPAAIAAAVTAAPDIDLGPDPRWAAAMAVRDYVAVYRPLPQSLYDLGFGGPRLFDPNRFRQPTVLPLPTPTDVSATGDARARGEVVHVPVTYDNIATILSVEVTVTDADGRTVGTRVLKTPLAQFIRDGSLGCDPGAVFNSIFELLRDGRPVTVTLPVGVIDLGSLQLSSDRPTSNGVCNNNATFRMVGASFAFFDNRLTGTNLTATVNRDRICLTSGTVALSPEFKAPPAQVPSARPLCVSLRSDRPPARNAGSPPTCTATNRWIEGQLDWPSTFPLVTLPAGFTPQTFSLSFSCADVNFSASARLGTTTALGASSPGALLSLSGAIDFDGGVDARLSVSDLSVLGGNASLAGGVTVPKGGGVARFNVRGSVTGADLGVNGLTLTRLSVTADNSGPNGALTFGLDGAGTFANGTLPYRVSGAYRGPDDWRVSAEAGGPGTWQPISGLTVTNARISGSIERSTPSGASQASTIADLRLDVDGDWTPVPALSLRRIGLRITNAPPISSCPQNLTAGSLWVGVDAAATIRPPGTEPLDLTTAACVAPGAGAFTLTTSTADGWTPVAGGDLRVDRVGFTIARTTTGDITFDALGTLQFRGVRLGARFVGAERSSTPADSYFVIDGWAAPAANGQPGTGTPDTSSLGVPLSGIHVIYASKNVADYENPSDAGFRTPLRQGVSVMGSITLPVELRSMLTKMGTAAPGSSGGRLIVSASYVNGSARVRADLRATDPTAGMTIFETCPSGPPCSDPNTTTGLDARSAFLEMTFGGGSTAFAIGAEATLRLPASGQLAEGEPPAQPSRLEVTLKASVDLTRQSISVALFTTGTWNDALGVRGLSLANLVIQGGVTFSGPPIPSLGMGATVVSLPASTRAKLGIANNEPMRFVFNISTSNPVLEITLGVRDGRTFLKPLALISPQRADDLLVDYASLVIAPAGGEVGPYVYSPGISLGFAATIGGTPVDISATLDIAGGRLQANADIGAFAVGPVELTRTTLDLDVSPTRVRFAFDGGFSVAGSNSRFAANVRLDAAATGAFSLALTANGQNIPLGLTGIAINQVDLSANVSVPGLGAPIQAFSFTADFQLDVLGARPRVRASMAMNNGVLQQVQALVTVPPLTVAGTGITGAGCDGVRNSGEDGVCVRLDYDITRTASPFEFVLTGAVAVAGVQADLTMSYDQNGFALAGTLDARPVAQVSVSGRLYRSSTTITVTTPSGQVLRPGDGDFTLSGRADVNLAGAAAANLTFNAGKVGAVAFIGAQGSVNSQVFALTVSGSFEGGGSGGVRYSIRGNGQVRLVGFAIDATVDIDQNGFGVSGTATLPLNIGTATLSGSMVYPTANSPLLFRLEGSGSVNDPISGYPALTGSFRLANMTAARAPQPPEFAFNAALALPIGNARATVEGRLYQNASNQPAVFLQGSAGVTMPVLGPTSALVGFGVNNDDGRNGVWVTVVALDTRVDGRLDRNGFLIGVQSPADGGDRVLAGSIGPAVYTFGMIIGGRVTYHFDGQFRGPSPLALSFNGRASATAYAYFPPPPGQTAPYNEITVAVEASNPPLRACFTLVAQVCLP